MKTKIWILILLLSGSKLIAQDFTPYRVSDKSDRELRKEKRAEEAEVNYKKINILVDTRRFVLEADHLSNRYGQNLFVASGLNFIAVDSLQTVIQTGNNNGIGYNGVGGVTASGNQTKYVVTRDDKKKRIMIRMDVLTGIGIYNIVMDISPSGYATAVLTGLGPGRLTFYGSLVPRNKSRVFKGSNTY
jgi:hypothetical protein